MSELRELTLSMKLFPIPARDEDMAFLKRLAKLESSQSINRQPQRRLAGLPRRAGEPEILHVTDTAMTAGGLDHLNRHSSLTARLTLVGTEFTLTRPNATDAEIAERGPMLRRIRLIHGR
jgi:hypothetical protein